MRYQVVFNANDDTYGIFDFNLPPKDRVKFLSEHEMTEVMGKVFGNEEEEAE